MIARLLATALGRWVLGGAVIALVGGAALMWHNHKEGLREEGIQECVQEINQATVDALQQQLADERAANAELSAQLAAAAVVNQERNERIARLASTLTTLKEQMEAQRNEDPTYREWSDSDLPAGVADRLRDAARSQAGGDDQDGR